MLLSNFLNGRQAWQGRRQQPLKDRHSRCSPVSRAFSPVLFSAAPCLCQFDPGYSVGYCLYRIYIDEVGNHDMQHVDDPGHRFLSLTGVILENDYTSRVLIPEMNCIKQDFFQPDPDEPVIFHRKELVNKRPPFHCLRDSDTEQRFNTQVLAALERWKYCVITVVIDRSYAVG